MITMNEDEFWERPLGVWLRDCITSSSAVVKETEWRPPSRTNLEVKFSEICDGLVLSLLFRHIDPQSIDVVVVKSSEELCSTSSKQRQLLFLLNGIRRFYRAQLNQLIVMSLPDIPCIVRNPTAELSGNEVNKLLLLLLGCAVHCGRNKLFIDRIQQNLNKEIQEGIARHIQQLTKTSTCVVSVQALELSSGDFLISVLDRLMQERDTYATALFEMAHEHLQESDEGSSTTGTNSLNGDIPTRKTTVIYDHRRSPSPTMLDRHTNVELASIKAEVRRLRNETEAKEEEIISLNDELQDKAKEILKLQEEKLACIKDVHKARDLSDELDCANQKLAKMEKLEQENDRLRDKVSELDYYKRCSEQLRKDTELLEEELELMKTQREEQKQKGRSTADTEKRLAESLGSIKVLHAEIAAKNKRIEELITEQTKMERELRDSSQRAAELEKELSGTDRTPRAMPDSLFAQLEESDRTETVQLRLANQKLKQRIEELEKERESSITSVVTELESKFEESQKLLVDQKEENEFINKQLNDLELTLSEVNQQYKESSDLCCTLREERDSAQSALQEARRNFAQFQAETERRVTEQDHQNTRRLELDLRELQRKLERAQEDSEEHSKMATRLKEEQRQLRSTVDLLEEEKKKVETASAQTERARKHVEAERNALKEKLERLEDEVENSRVRLLCTEDGSKRLANTEKLLVEIQNKVGDLEQENRTLTQQLELELRKVQSLREDLVSEKSRAADLVSRLRSVCTGIAINGGKIDQEMDDNELIQSIDDVIMTALNAARREADALRIQQHAQIAELTDLKRDIEKLKRAENVSLNESDDRVRQLSQENTNIKEQVYLLQEKTRELQIEIAARTSESTIAKREAEELRTNTTNTNKLHNDIAKLQVSLRNAQLQEELLKQDNSELRVQADLLEKSKKELKKELDQLSALNETLLVDQDRLQQLHDLLTIDYERAKFEIGEMKNKLRNEKVPSKAAQQEVDDLRAAIRNERMNHDRTLKQAADAQNEMGHLRRDLQSLRKENECLSRSCEGLNAEVYKLKLSDHAQKATIKNLNITIEDLTRRLESKEIEMNNLRNKIEMVTQLNRTVEEESRNLSRQVDMLITQNKELLNRALSEKDQYHQEQREFQEKLSNLRRHKEKLEEKIMDQYKSMENKKNRDKGNTLVKRAAKALIPKKSRSADKNSGSTTEDSSVYSADEALNGRHDDDLIPTCSSSEDADRVSPRDVNPAYESYGMRSRQSVIGGSVRCFPIRRPITSSHLHTMNVSGMGAPRTENGSHGSERCVVDRDRSLSRGALPPRIPVRNTPLTQSLRARPPPPPYPAKPKHRPAPPYLPMTSTPNSSMISEFDPQFASTPKSDRSASPRRNGELPNVVKEGERRDFVRDLDERIEKALSVYENVQQNDSIASSTTVRNESTVWYEYGCV